MYNMQIIQLYIHCWQNVKLNLLMTFQIAHLKKQDALGVTFEGIQLGRNGELCWILVRSYSLSCRQHGNCMPVSGCLSVCVSVYSVSCLPACLPVSLSLSLFPLLLSVSYWLSPLSSSLPLSVCLLPPPSTFHQSLLWSTVTKW